MNNDNFLIESSDIDVVKELCACIDQTDKRSAAVANMLAAEISKKYFTEIELDDVTTLHEIPQVLEDIEISDIYIKNNYIDVRLYFDNQSLFIPKSHFENEILPLAYMFIKSNEDLSSGVVTGFLLTSSLNPNGTQGEYIKISEEDLVSFYDLESNIAFNDTVDIDENFEIDMFNYLDGKLTNKKDFYNLLLKSPEARIRLKNAAKAKLILNFISITNDIDSPLISNTKTSLDIPTESITLEEEQQDEEFVLDMDFENADNLEASEDSSFIEIENEDTPILEISSETEDIIDLKSNKVDFEDEVFILEEKTSNQELPKESESLDIESNLNTDIVDNTEENSEECIDLSFDNTNKNTELNESIIDEPDEIGFNTLDLALETTEENNITDVKETLDISNNDNEPKESVITKEPITDDLLNAQEYLINEDETKEDVKQEPNDYSTNVTPSLNTIEDQVEIIDENDLIESLETDFNDTENTIETEDSEQTVSEDIDVLFKEEDIIETQDNKASTSAKQRNSNPITLLGALAVLFALGYFGYTKFYNNETIPSYTKEPVSTTTKVASSALKTETKTPEIPVAMPNETVENTRVTQQSNEAISETIPVIESNLDTPVTITNLAVKWEVPASYISS